jgi:hypothetical protein
MLARIQTPQTIPNSLEHQIHQNSQEKGKGRGKHKRFKYKILTHEFRGKDLFIAKINQVWSYTQTVVSITHLRDLSQYTLRLGTHQPCIRRGQSLIVKT